MPKELPSTETLRKLFDYDQETGYFYWKVRSGSKGVGKRAGAVSGGRYRIITINGVSYAEHRLAFAWMGLEPGPCVDHIDRNKNNNAWSNLRSSTRVENANNREFKKKSSSGERHIFERPSRIAGNPSKWRVIINRPGNGGKLAQTYLTKEEAIKARDSYLKTLDGN